MIVVFIDCGVSKSQTPERIIQRLEEDGLKVVRNPSHIPDEEYVVIRWGSDRYPELDEGAKAVLNPARAINGNLHKDKAHAKFLEAGVSAPLFWNDFETARAACRELGCDFLRRRKHHIQGQDIIRLSPTDNLPRAKRSGYYVQFLEKDREFRLHIFQDRCIEMAEKKKREGDNPNPIIWNFENGWELVYYAKEEREEAVSNYREMVAESVKAVKALGLDFGAVDLIMVKDKAYILEANSAPKLKDTNRYAKNFKRWVESLV